MNVDIDKVIYLYLYTCTALILFNIFYVFSSSRQKRKHYEYANKWRKCIEEQLILLKDGHSIGIKHKEELERRLISTKQLISYAYTLDMLRNEGEILEGYLCENQVSIQLLAHRYSKKEVYDRAFFAFFISKNPPCTGRQYNQLMKILISYMDNSTIYSRENILRALYVLGNAQAIETAFQIMNDRKWFHHHKLLSDGLMTFTGDKEELSERLWKNLKSWEENLALSIIKFITLTSDKFKERLFLMVQSKDISLEVHIEIIRYFRIHIHEPIRAVLINYFEDTYMIDENIKIVAASVLDQYPGEETIIVLKHALKSPNWHIRYNAALSLKNLKLSIDELQDVIMDDDRYANEMITYMMDR